MYANLLNYMTGEKQVVAEIRVVEGQLRVTGDIPDRSREHLEEEYAIFKERIDPTGDAKTFLKDRLAFVFAGSTYIKTQFVPEG